IPQGLKPLFFGELERPEAKASGSLEADLRHVETGSIEAASGHLRLGLKADSGHVETRQIRWLRKVRAVVVDPKVSGSFDCAARVRAASLRMTDLFHLKTG